MRAALVISCTPSFRRQQPRASVFWCRVDYSSAADTVKAARLLIFYLIFSTTSFRCFSLLFRPFILLSVFCGKLVNRLIKKSRTSQYQGQIEKKTWTGHVTQLANNHHNIKMCTGLLRIINIARHFLSWFGIIVNRQKPYRINSNDTSCTTLWELSSLRFTAAQFRSEHTSHKA